MELLVSLGRVFGNRKENNNFEKIRIEQGLKSDPHIHSEWYYRAHDMNAVGLLKKLG